jgi:selenide, water dikinase
MNTKIKLTEYSRSAGCSCKISPQVLQEILHSDDTNFKDPLLLVGNQHADDAAVRDIGNGLALVSTADFFMPIVNDAYQFGQIAAANALSDVYAMGAAPVMATAILGWPTEKLSAELAAEVMKGARALCTQAKVEISGGHTIDCAEPFFGLSVNGIMAKDKIRSNSMAQAGDVLYLTKPIGLGILSAAHKRGVATELDNQVMLHAMLGLNSVGKDLAELPYVRTFTDVTGFGLAGHMIELCEASNISAQVQYSKMPILATARALQQKGITPDATYRNWNSYSAKIELHKDVPVMEAFTMLPDPQTNGGLLIAVASDHTAAFESWYLQTKAEHIEPFAACTEQGEKILYINP